MGKNKIIHIIHVARAQRKHHSSVNQPYTLRAVPVENSSEWTRTWSSCVAHSTKAALIVPGGGIPSTQSLPVSRNSLDIFDELHMAGERVK